MILLSGLISLGLGGQIRDNSICTFLALLLRVDLLQFDPLELSLHFFFERIFSKPDKRRLMFHPHAIVLHVFVHDVVGEFAANKQ